MIDREIVALINRDNHNANEDIPPDQTAGKGRYLDQPLTIINSEQPTRRTQNASHLGHPRAEPFVKNQANYGAQETQRKKGYDILVAQRKRTLA